MNKKRALSLILSLILIFSNSSGVLVYAAKNNNLKNYNKQQITTTFTQELDDIAESFDLSNANQKTLLSDLYNLNRYALDVRFLSLCCTKSDTTKNKLDLSKGEVDSYVNELAVLTESFNNQYGTASTKYFNVSIKIPSADKRNAETLCASIFNKTYKYCKEYLGAVDDAYKNNGTSSSTTGIAITANDQSSLISKVSPYVYSIKEILENYGLSLNGFKSYDLLKSCYFMEDNGKTVTFINNVNKLLRTDYNTVIDACSNDVANGIATRQVDLSVNESYIESLTNCIVTENGVTLAEGEEVGALKDAYKALLSCSAVYEPFVSASGGDEFTNALKGLCKSLNLSDNYDELYNMYSNVNGFRKPLYFRPYNDKDGTSLGNAKQLTVEEFCDYINKGISGTLVTIKGKLKQDVSTGTWYYFKSKETTVVHNGTDVVTDAAAATSAIGVSGGAISGAVSNSAIATDPTTQTLEQGDTTFIAQDDSEFQKALERNEATEATDVVTRQDMITDPVLKFCYEENWGRAEDNLTYAVLYNILQDAPLDNFKDSNNYLYLNAFGDIIDENGIVILPAAANPTYYDEPGKSKEKNTESTSIVYNPYTVAFMNSYPEIAKDGTELKLVNMEDSGKFIITNEIFQGSGMKVLDYYLDMYNDLDTEVLELKDSSVVSNDEIDETWFKETKGNYLRLAKITQKKFDAKKKSTSAAKVDVVDNLQCCTINLKFYTDSSETKNVLYQAPFATELGAFTKFKIGMSIESGIMADASKGTGFIGNIAGNVHDTASNFFGKGVISKDLYFEGNKVITTNNNDLKSVTEFVVPVYKRSPLTIGGEAVFPYRVEDDAVESSTDIAYPAATKIAINMFNSFRNTESDDVNSSDSALAENYIIENVITTGLGGTNSTHAYANNGNQNYKNVVADQDNRFIKFLNSLSENLVTNFGKTTGVIGIHSMYNNSLFGSIFTWLQSYWYLLLFVFMIILVIGFLRQEKDAFQSAVHLALSAALIYVLIAVIPAYLPMVYNSIINEVSNNLSYETLALKAEKDNTTYSAATDDDTLTGQGKMGQKVSSITLYKAPLQNPIQSLFGSFNETSQVFDSLADSTDVVKSTSNSFYENLGITRDEVTGGSQFVISEPAGSYAEDDSLKMDLSSLFKNLKVKGSYEENEDGSKIYKFKATKTTSDNLDYYTPYYSFVDCFIGKLNDLTDVYQIPRSSLRYSDGTVKDKFLVYSYCNSLPFLSGGRYEYTEGNDDESDTSTREAQLETVDPTAPENTQQTVSGSSTTTQQTVSGSSTTTQQTVSGSSTTTSQNGDGQSVKPVNDNVNNQLADYVINESNSLSDTLYEKFGDNNDWLGMSAFLASPTEEQKGTLWYKTMVKNGYYDSNGNPNEDKMNRLVKSVNNNTRKFIFDSPDLINNCSDEVLIKTICLYADTCFNTKISSLNNWVYPFSLNYDDYTIEDTVTSILTASDSKYIGHNLNVVDYVQTSFSWPSLIAFDLMIIMMYLIVSIINIMIPCMYLLLCILILAKLFFGKPLISAFKGFAKSNVILFILSVVFNVALNLLRKLDGNPVSVWILVAICMVILYFITLMITSILTNLSDFGYKNINAKLDGLDNKVGFTKNIQAIKASFKKETSFENAWDRDDDENTNDVSSGFNAYSQSSDVGNYDDQVILSYDDDVSRNSRATSGSTVSAQESNHNADTFEIDFDDE